MLFYLKYNGIIMVNDILETWLGIGIEKHYKEKYLCLLI